MQGAVGGTILGTTGFVEKVAARHLGEKEPAREVPALRQLLSRPAPEEILKAVDAAFGADKKMARQAGMYLCHRYSGEKVREIGERFGVGPSAVTEASRLFPRRLAKRKDLAEIVDRIKAELKI